MSGQIGILWALLRNYLIENHFLCQILCLISIVQIYELIW